MSMEELWVVAIVTAGLMFAVKVAADIYKRRLAVREREIELNAPRAAGQDTAAQATIAKLEERVRVLERIATDKSQTVAAQIEALREPAALADTRAKEVL
jgi:hypothetical protein